MGLFEDDWAGATTDPAEPTPPGGPTGPAGADTSAGKHAILLVPDFKNSAVTGAGRPMTSYLRLGDAHSQAGPAVPAGPAPHPLRTDLGEDLASLVQGFTDDTRDRAGGGPQSSAHLSSSSPPANPSTSLDDTDARRAESAQLHSKGGWRDHSDGNRISTTRGDKVEVIRGNYKLLVLGRSDPPAPLSAAADGYVDTSGWGNVTGMELAGGNVDTSDLAYGSSADPGAGTARAAVTDPSRTLALQTSFVWHQDLDGNWGWRQTTTVGSPDVPVRPPGGNNQIISNTWVDYQETNLGSAVKRVSNIVGTTYADTMTQTTDVTGTINQWTNAGTLRNGVTANTINNTTTAGGQSALQAIGVNFVGNAYAASLEADVSLTMIGLAQAAALLATVQTAVMIVNEQISPMMINTFLGNCVDMHTGTHVDSHAGMHVDNHSGVHLDIHGGAHASVENGTVVDMTNFPVARVAAAFHINMHTTTVTTSSGPIVEAAAAFSRL